MSNITDVKMLSRGGETNCRENISERYLSYSLRYKGRKCRAHLSFILPDYRDMDIRQVVISITASEVGAPKVTIGLSAQDHKERFTWGINKKVYGQQDIADDEVLELQVWALGKLNAQ